jgi:hypothetical protein
MLASISKLKCSKSIGKQTEVAKESFHFKTSAQTMKEDLAQVTCLALKCSK